MTRNEFINGIEASYAACVDLIRKKNQDYGGIGDPLKNFRMCELAGVCSMETGIYTRVLDKLARIATYINDGTLSVDNENVDDTIDDACNYLQILKQAIIDRDGRQPIAKVHTNSEFADRLSRVLNDDPHVASNAERAAHDAITRDTSLTPPVASRDALNREAINRDASLTRDNALTHESLAASPREGFTASPDPYEAAKARVYTTDAKKRLVNPKLA